MELPKKTWIFSKRVEAAVAVEEYFERTDTLPNTFNVVSALDFLGLLAVSEPERTVTDGLEFFGGFCGD